MKRALNGQFTKPKEETGVTESEKVDYPESDKNMNHNVYNFTFYFQFIVVAFVTTLMMVPILHYIFIRKSSFWFWVVQILESEFGCPPTSSTLLCAPCNCTMSAPLGGDLK